jgi:anaerobic carbon-monoxide dehydrogenase iron sulfur subunit
MKTVVIHPERCIGCMQCMSACAQAHSRSQSLYGAIREEPRPSPRIYVGPGPGKFAFPNKCRHCDPAPCLSACMTAALRREAASGAVLVDSSRCINCGMCAMACPFGAVRYRADYTAPGKRAVAVKCDNCSARWKEGKPPACAEACLVKALEFGEPNELLKEEGRKLARRIWAGLQDEGPERPAPAPVALWRALGAASDAAGPGR